MVSTMRCEATAKETLDLLRSNEVLIHISSILPV